MSLSKGSNRNTAKETHLNERNFDSFNTNNNEKGRTLITTDKKSDRVLAGWAGPAG